MMMKKRKKTERLYDIVNNVRDLFLLAFIIRLVLIVIML